MAGTGYRCHVLGPDVPAVKHREPRGHIAQGDREIEVLIGLLHRGEPVAQNEPVVVDEPDLLGASCGRALNSTGRSPTFSACSDMRPARLAERVAEKVASARTRVPPAVASEAMVLVVGHHAQATGRRARLRPSPHLHSCGDVEPSDAALPPGGPGSGARGLAALAEMAGAAPALSALAALPFSTASPAWSSASHRAQLPRRRLRAVLAAGPRCTPGALNPAVTQARIGSTICRSGWTATVRPPSRSPSPRRSRASPPTATADRSSYEYDRDVPLELGGAVNDPRNLWPEPDYPSRSGFYLNPRTISSGR